MAGFRVFEGSKYGSAPSIVGPTTITAQNTWTEWLDVPGDAGGHAMMGLMAKLTGAPIITVQVRHLSSPEVICDFADTAGVSNGKKISPVDGWVVFPRWSYRAGVKTGQLNAGSAIIILGS